MDAAGSPESRARTLRVVLAVVVVASLATIAVAMAVNAFDLTKAVDRSGPTMLERIRTLEEFTSAEASFVQDVDLEQGTKFLPSFVAGERVVALVRGSVRATVDFGDLGAGAISVDEDSSTIRIALPQPTLSDVDIDEKTVRVLARERGLTDRIEDFFATNPTDDAALFVAAEQKMHEAAEQSDLLARGRANTERWLDTFLGAAGFDTVIVTWQ